MKQLERRGPKRRPPDLEEPLLKSESSSSPTEMTSCSTENTQLDEGEAATNPDNSPAEEHEQDKPAAVAPCHCEESKQEMNLLEEECQWLKDRLKTAKEDMTRKEQENTRKFNEVRDEHRRKQAEVKQVLVEQQGHGELLKGEMNKLTADHKTEMQRLANENQDLRQNIDRLKLEIQARSIETDEENLKISKLLTKLRKAKKSMKTIRGHEDESYIEIIIA